MAVAERLPPPLNTDQVDVILAEGLQRELIETDVEGQLPSDPAERLKMAQTLVVMADQHFQAGSRDENVKAILFIAEVDLAPNHNTEGEDVAESGMGGLEDSVLVKVERSMTEFDGEEPSDELREIRAEIERRELPTPWKAESNGHAAEPEAEAPTDDAMIQRKNLEDELVGRGLDPAEVTTLSDETLRWIVDHPEPATKKEEEAASEPEAPVEPQTIETTHVVIPGAKSEEPTPADEPETDADPPISSTLSPEREELESQVTGPMLKVFGRGRKDVEHIGINELRFMVEHPDGSKVTQEQLDAAKALDTGDAPAESEQPAAEESEPASEPEPETPAEPEAAQAEQPEEAEPEPEPETPAPAPEEQELEPDPDLHVPEEAKRDAREYFDAMIEKEHLPLPPEITEKPPVLPFDMSKCSYDEVFSLHARFHACEARMNFLITHEEDSLGDLEKLRTARELVVAAALPATIDGKRITDAQRAARVAADPQVQVYVTAEHNIAKTLRKQKVLSNNYHRDCERSSRQLTKWTKEFGGSA